MRTLYHVSLKSNLESIMEKGLIPQIGDRSAEMKEDGLGIGTWMSMVKILT